MIKLILFFIIVTSTAMAKEPCLKDSKKVSLLEANQKKQKTEYKRLSRDWNGTRKAFDDYNKKCGQSSSPTCQPMTFQMIQNQLMGLEMKKSRLQAQMMETDRHQTLAQEKLSICQTKSQE